MAAAPTSLRPWHSPTAMPGVGCSDRSLAKLVAECDGTRTWREHYERAKATQLIPAEASAEEFAGLLLAFVADGIVRLPDGGL